MNLGRAFTTKGAKAAFRLALPLWFAAMEASHSPFSHPPWKEAIFLSLSLWCWVTHRLIQEIIKTKLFLIFFFTQGATVSSNCNFSSSVWDGCLRWPQSTFSMKKLSSCSEKRYDCRLVNKSWLPIPPLHIGSSKGQSWTVWEIKLQW